MEREELGGNLAFIGTGADGFFRVSIDLGFDGQREILKVAKVKIPSGRLYFGAGECLPCEGCGTVLAPSDLDCMALPPGEYWIVISTLIAHSDSTIRYQVSVSETDLGWTEPLFPSRTTTVFDDSVEIIPELLIASLDQSLDSPPVVTC